MKTATAQPGLTQLCTSQGWVSRVQGLYCHRAFSGVIVNSYLSNPVRRGALACPTGLSGTELSARSSPSCPSLCPQVQLPHGTSDKMLPLFKV